MDYNDPLWQFKQLEKALANLRPVLSSSEDVARMLASSVKGLEYLSGRYLLPPNYLEQFDSVARVAEEMVTETSFPAIFEVDRSASSALFSAQEHMSRVLESIGSSSISDEMLSANSRIAQTLIAPESMLQASLINQEMAKLMMQPQVAFSEFAEERLAAIDGRSELYAKNTLSAISAGASLLETMSDGLEFAALVARESVSDALSLEVNAFTCYDHFITAHLNLEEEQDFDVIVEELSIEKISQLGSDLIELVFNINTEAERLGREPVFTPTTKALRACCILPTRIATSEESFNEIVDQLFFLLYEGSGAAKRLLVKADEEVEKAAMEPLWGMKQLRLAARHDVSHGKPAEIKKKNKVIGESFLSLIGKVMPKEDVDWQNAQYELYSRLIGVLEHYWYI